MQIILFMKAYFPVSPSLYILPTQTMLFVGKGSHLNHRRLSVNTLKWSCQVHSSTIPSQVALWVWSL